MSLRSRKSTRSRHGVGRGADAANALRRFRASNPDSRSQQRGRVGCDIVADNGVIHVIDSVVLPK
jgi:uncharacterized surface protein with fasciclin (FAS1) repeats